jgi:hypothetical protein
MCGASVEVKDSAGLQLSRRRDNRRDGESVSDKLHAAVTVLPRFPGVAFRRAFHRGCEQLRCRHLEGPL